MTSRIVFVDKDGTLVQNGPTNVNASRIQLMPGADVALGRLSRAGFRVVVVSNQAGVAFGHFAESALNEVRTKLRELLATRGVPLAGFFYSPHHPQGTVEGYRKRCRCRTPAPGLITRAAHALDASLAECWMVGDTLDDIEAGHRAGMRSILFDSGGETEWLLSPLRRPDAVVSAFEDIADIILNEADTFSLSPRLFANDEVKAP